MENSGSPHEASVISAIKVFKELNYDVRVILGTLAYKRLHSVLDKDVKIYKGYRLWDLLKIIRDIRGGGLMYQNTVSLQSSPLSLYLALLTKHNIYYVRNATSWFEFRPNTNKLVVKLMGLCLFLTKRFLLTRAEALVVGHYNVDKYLRQKTTLPIFYMPFNLRDVQAQDVALNPRLKIVIPGTVDFSRKNNTVIADTLQALDQRYLDNIEVVFLGKAVNKQAKEVLESWKASLGNSLVYYTGFIAQEEFDQQLAHADIIMGVINIHHESKYYTEKYGQTKDTGLEGHAVGFAKPFFVNTEYFTDPQIESSVVKFSSVDELKRVIEKAVDDRDWLLRMKQEAIENGKKFDLQTVVKKVEQVLNP